MALSTADLNAARAWIGEKEPTAVFEERYDRLGNLSSAIRESMTAQLMAFIVNRDASVQLDDGTAINSGENIRSLSKLIADFDATGVVDPDGGSTGAMGVTKLQRRRYR